jgi:hypothetical protein
LDFRKLEFDGILNWVVMKQFPMKPERFNTLPKHKRMAILRKSPNGIPSVSIPQKGFWCKKEDVNNLDKLAHTVRLVAGFGHFYVFINNFFPNEYYSETFECLKDRCKYFYFCTRSKSYKTGWNCYANKKRVRKNKIFCELDIMPISSYNIIEDFDYNYKISSKNNKLSSLRWFHV